MVKVVSIYLWVKARYFATIPAPAPQLRQLVLEIGGGQPFICISSAAFVLLIAERNQGTALYTSSNTYLPHPFFAFFRVRCGAERAVWVSMEKLEDGPLEEHCIAAVLRDVLSALVYLHAEKKIHRDLKASNVLLSATGAVKVSCSLPRHGSYRLRPPPQPCPRRWPAPRLVWWARVF